MSWHEDFDSVLSSGIVECGEYLHFYQTMLAGNKIHGESSYLAPPLLECILLSEPAISSIHLVQRLTRGRASAWEALQRHDFLSVVEKSQLGRQHHLRVCIVFGEYCRREGIVVWWYRQYPPGEKC